MSDKAIARIFFTVLGCAMAFIICFAVVTIVRNNHVTHRCEERGGVIAGRAGLCIDRRVVIDDR